MTGQSANMLYLFEHTVSMRAVCYLVLCIPLVLFGVTGCTSPSSSSGLERAAAQRIESMNGEQVHVIHWASNEGELVFLDGKPWRKSSCTFHSDTLKYEIVEPRSKNTPHLGLVSFDVTFEHTPYYESESAAENSEQFYPPSRVDCRLEYHLVDDVWEFGRVTWHNLSGHGSRVDERLMVFFGASDTSQ